jgi:hypothetical protein
MADTNEQVNVGANGVWRATITGVASQANWNSDITVKLYMKNNSPATSYNNDGATMSITGSKIADWSGSIPFNVSAGAEDLVRTQVFSNIAHDSAGNLTVTVKCTLGATSTGTFGSGGSVTVSIVMPTLASVPGTPGVPSVTNITANSFQAKFIDNADDGGPSVSERRIYYNTVNSHTGESYVLASSNTYVTIPGLVENQDYYLWSRTKNSIGWSGYSGVKATKTLSRPSPPSAPVVTNIRQTEFSYSFTDGADNGTAINGREIAYSLTQTGTKTIFSSTGSGKVTGLPKDPSTGVQGKPLYVWARNSNSVNDSDWSAYKLITVLAGAKVRSGGVWKDAVPYVRSGGVWKLAEPYARLNSAWKYTIP